MTNGVKKVFFRQIRDSKSRFISILLIVALGIGFFVGVKAASPSMKYSADKFFYDNNLMDYKLISDYGFQEDDIKALKELSGIKQVMPSYSADLLLNSGNSNSVVRVQAVPENFDNSQPINDLKIIDGRLPEESGECVLESSINMSSAIKYEIGDTIELLSPDDNENIENVVKTSRFKVVGFVESPQYIAFDKGITQVGDGSILTYIMILGSDFQYSRYTEVFLRIDTSKNYESSFDNDYKEYIEDYESNLENLAEERIEINRESMLREFQLIKAETSVDVNLLEDDVNEKLNEIENLSIGKWYIFTREDNPGYTSFIDDVTRIDGIARIFPLFFFVVAALVCLTTMTRMVEEERIQIGTFKALGYENRTIAAKYFFYAFFAAILGSVLGVILGLAFLPKTIFHSYDAMYKIPVFSVKVSVPVIIISVICALLCTCTVAYLVAYKELRLDPATLMRPKAPKQGKRILIERITFIWKRMNFSSKVTTRNIFRYKARFIMTVLGVAGCTALILAAYGLKDSISVVVPKQYGEIFTYDTMMNLKDEGTLEEKKNLKETIALDNRIESSIMIKQSIMTGSSKYSKEKIEVRLFVPESLEMFKNYVNLLDKDTGKKIELKENNVVITEKLAKLLNLSVGDTLTISDDVEENIQLNVSGITENYVYNYVYISPQLYEDKFSNNLNVNTILLKLTEKGKANEDEVAKDWLKKSDILVVTLTSYLISNFEDMISSLNSVVALMIICAAVLAFVVLYNLTNINIAERMREIATIKVLGFTEREAANYVYRENIVLSIIGIIIGLLLGRVLSNYIVATIEMDIVMFGRTINTISFVYASALTLIFTLLVNLSMYKRIDNISMVESLKSVE